MQRHNEHCRFALNTHSALHDHFFIVDLHGSVWGLTEAIKRLESCTPINPNLIISMAVPTRLILSHKLHNEYCSVYIYVNHFLSSFNLIAMYTPLKEDPDGGFCFV